jgi:hypothetical protein
MTFTLPASVDRLAAGELPQSGPEALSAELVTTEGAEDRVTEPSSAR